MMNAKTLHNPSFHLEMSVQRQNHYHGCSTISSSGCCILNLPVLWTFWFCIYNVFTMVISNFVITFIPYIFYVQSKSCPCQPETFNSLYLWKNLYISEYICFGLEYIFTSCRSIRSLVYYVFAQTEHLNFELVYTF